MKLIFKPDGTLWIISKSGSHPDVSGCESIVVDNEFDYVKERQKSEFDEKLTYVTFDEVKAKLEITNG